VPSLRAGVAPDALQLKRLLVVLLAGTCLMPVGAAAQTTSWVGPTGTCNEPTNWNPACVPSVSSTAIFDGGGGGTDNHALNVGLRMTW
jgi:hypothetical protein